jgi:predicted ester cyclase
MKLNNVNVIDVEVDNVDMKDYPDFCDAYISEAKFTNGKSLDDNQLAELQEQNIDEFSELVLDEFLSIADRHY